jgi:hypothetical protein
MNLMMRLIVLSLWLPTFVPKASAQAPTICVTNQDSTLATRVYFTEAVKNFPDTLLTLYGLPRQSVPDISVVTDDSLCARARDAFNAAYPTTDTLYVVTRAIVLRVGPERYVVAPARQRGPLRKVVFDSAFQAKGAVVSF